MYPAPYAVSHPRRALGSTEPQGSLEQCRVLATYSQRKTISLLEISISLVDACCVPMPGHTYVQVVLQRDFLKLIIICRIGIPHYGLQLCSKSAQQLIERKVGSYRDGAWRRQILPCVGCVRSTLSCTRFQEEHAGR